MLNYKNLLLLIILALSVIIFTHNILLYPLMSGYDAVRKTTYAKIISEEFRFPSYQETSEAFDAPLFYFVSGLTARLIAPIGNLQFIEALGSVRFLVSFLAIISFYLWYKIFTGFYPKNKYGSIIFLLLLSSMPAFYKVGAMFVSELLCLFIAVIIIYYFINVFLKKPTYKNAVILSVLTSIGLLTRISFFSLTLALLLGIFLFFFSQKKAIVAIKMLAIFLLILTFLTGWFYLIRQHGRPLDFGTYRETAEKIPEKEKQRLAFYYDIPLKYMMNFPFRPYLSSPNSFLIPIYYSDFWGDYWNYFPQRRFGIKEFISARANREVFSDSRKQYLVWQSRVNFIPTLLMAAGFIYLLISRSVSFLKKKINRRILAEFFFLMLVIITWTGLIVIVSQYRGQGDFIKASYTLFITPIYVYLATVFLFSYLRKIKIIFWPTILILLFSVVNNFIFSWF